MISVVLPVFNQQGTVRRALLSVLRQSYQHFELIVVNDGSTDSSAAEAQRALNGRGRLVHQGNSGVSEARNSGIRQAQADVIAFLDADDEWLPGFLAEIDAMRSRHPDCSVFATRYLIQRPGGLRCRPILRAAEADREPDCVIGDYFAVAARSDPPVLVSAVAVKSEALLSVGGFPPGITSGEDLLTWARLAIHFKVALSARYLSVYHQDNGSATVARMPDEGDPVGRGLKVLLAQAPAHCRPGLQRYIGTWHKIQASTFLQAGSKMAGIRETLHALRWAPGMAKLYCYLFAALLPTPLTRAVFMRYQAYRTLENSS